MPRRIANRVFWLLLTASALMLVVGVPMLHGQSKAAFTRSSLQQLEVLDGLSAGGQVDVSVSASSDDVQGRLFAPVRDETYGQFLWSAAVLTIAAGAILAIAFFVRYQISTTDEERAD
ncbi:MAG: hypothetical protein ABL309_09745 [Phycisphaerales bacterium]